MFSNLFKGFQRSPELNPPIVKDDPRATRLESMGLTLEEAKIRRDELLAELKPFNIRILDKTIAPFQKEIYEQKIKELDDLAEVIEIEESAENSA